MEWAVLHHMPQTDSLSFSFIINQMRSYRQIAPWTLRIAFFFLWNEIEKTWSEFENHSIIELKTGIVIPLSGTTQVEKVIIIIFGIAWAQSMWSSKQSKCWLHKHVASYFAIVIVWLWLWFEAVATKCVEFTLLGFPSTRRLKYLEYFAWKKYNYVASSRYDRRSACNTRDYKMTVEKFMHTISCVWAVWDVWALRNRYRVYFHFGICATFVSSVHTSKHKLLSLVVIFLRFRYFHTHDVAAYINMINWRVSAPALVPRNFRTT